VVCDTDYLDNVKLIYGAKKLIPRPLLLGREGEKSWFEALKVPFSF
jgi:hypothetical protein